MTKLLSDEALRQLGLDESALLTEALLPEPTTTVGQGLAVGALKDPTRASVTTTPISLPLLDRLGLEAMVEGSPAQKLWIYAVRGMPLQLDEFSLKGGWAGIHQQDPATAWVNLKNSARALVTVVGGGGLVVEKADGPVTLAAVLLGPVLDVKAPPSLPDMPSETWLDASSEAAEIRGELKLYLEGPRPWEPLVGAGLLAKLARGEAHQALHWARGLDNEQLGYVADSLCSRLERLEEHLERLETDADLGSADWLESLRAYLRGWDEADSVRGLLSHAEQVRSATGEPVVSDRASIAWRACEAPARLFVETLPSDLTVRDALLLRVAEEDPTAWWAGPADLRS